MALIGYFLAIVMGGVLGMLGGGGSILLVPILVYTFGIPAVVATSYSLVIVGATSAVGVIKHHNNRMVDYVLALQFAIPAMGGVTLSRIMIIPALPNSIELGSLLVSQDQFMMIGFSALLLSAAAFMLKSRDSFVDTAGNGLDIKRGLKLSIGGFFIGMLTGFFGAGGGFIIVPSLLVLAKIPLKKAIATSLFVIALNSFMGFLGDWVTGTQFDWSLIAGLLCFTFLGVVAGSKVSQVVPARLLRRLFACFIIVMAMFIVYKELY